MTNRVDIGGSMTGPLIQSGGSVRVNDINVSPATPRARLAAEIAEVRALLKAHAALVPRHAMTDVCLGQIAAQVREPAEPAASAVGPLWREIQPELSTLAESVAGLAELGPRLAAISSGIRALD
ncbi:hypothetical protein ACTG9Q_22220 [Actinokineospora sp. 24-640]